MKKLIFLFLVSTTCFSQIKKVETEKSIDIGKIGAMGQTWIECTKSGNTYTFLYQDLKYQQITEYKSFSFEDVDNAFDNLYETMLNGLENKPNEDIMLELPNDIIWLKFKKSFGKTTVEFWHAVNKNSDVLGYSVWMDKKRLAKVFGKN